MPVDEDVDDEREEELCSLSAIFPELQIASESKYTAKLLLAVAPVKPLIISFHSIPDTSKQPPHAAPPVFRIDDGGNYQPNIHDETSVTSHALAHLPPLSLEIRLPSGYPAEKPPDVSLTSSHKWLNDDITKYLEARAQALWEEYGRCQILYSFIDFLQQNADDGFDLAKSNSPSLRLNKELEVPLLDFDRKTKRDNFNQGSYDCGICLEPRKGAVCHQMIRCGHVFCLECLRNFYNNAIEEGDVSSVRCLDPYCGEKKVAATTKRILKSSRTLGPGELLQMGIEKVTVQRYVDLKRKKKLEADKTTIYCPRDWCRGPARSKKNPKVASILQLESYGSDSEDEAQQALATEESKSNETDDNRLCICEDCQYAFCKTCLSGWHGDFVRCWVRTSAEMSEEDKQSYNWIRLNTSPCPTCDSPCQKKHGCNHMTCFQCHTHFCYLCSAWLEPTNPYQHYNNKKKGCYQRLWELEEGDAGLGNARFDGPRGWEAAAQAVAAAEPHLAAALGPAQADAVPGGEAVHGAMINVQLEDRPPARARDRGRERVVGNGNGLDVLPNEARLGLERFIQLAQEDREDEWDSDELDEDGHDADWEIPIRD